MNREFWSGKTVLLTGHTGFKGGWLATWLADLGAEVHGYALAPSTSPALYSVAALDRLLASSTIADIRDYSTLADVVSRIQPQIIFHLAAQPLVRYSYRNPLETYQTNVLGVANLLEAIRASLPACCVVNVTTDKCYENKEWVWPYRETDGLGGHDPYSSSKACAELVTAAFRKSYFQGGQVAIATARAGNVIGGGDWAEDRLVPDFLRASSAGDILEIRSPESVRPWQHVLEPLSGYMLLAESLFVHGMRFAESWNFGPDDVDAKSVRWVVDRLCSLVPGSEWNNPPVESVHEAGLLRLDSSKARAGLGWSPRWSLDVALEKTIEWHKAWLRGENMLDFSRLQIRQYQAANQADLEE